MMDRLRELATQLWRKARLLPFRSIAKSAALVVAATAVTFWLTFPVDAALENARRYAAENGLYVSYDRASMLFFGPTLHDVTVESRVDLKLDRVDLRPKASTLWLRPGLHISGELGDGWFWLESGLGAGYDVDLAADALDVLALGLGSSLPFGLNLDGMLSAEGEFYWSRNPSDVTGEVRVAIDKPHLFSEVMPLPTTSIAFSSIKLKLTAANGMLTIAPLSIDGDEVWGTIRGTIELNRNLMLSKADIRIQLHFNQALDSAVGALLPMAGFRKEKDAYVRQYNGAIGKIGG